jgi:putative endonuclease
VTAERSYYVYLLTNWNNKVMYVGVTNDLERRIYEHKNKTLNGFTEKYNIDKLVYFEHTTDVTAALEREKEIKKWRREKKNNLSSRPKPCVERFERGMGGKISPFGRNDIIEPYHLLKEVRTQGEESKLVSRGAKACYYDPATQDGPSYAHPSIWV